MSSPNLLIALDLRTAVGRPLAHCKKKVAEDITNVQNIDLVEKPVGVKKGERLTCLDSFRGLTMFLMVFVNYQGGNYELFNHSLWNG